MLTDPAPGRIEEYFAAEHFEHLVSAFPTLSSVFTKLAAEHLIVPIMTMLLHTDGVVVFQRFMAITLVRFGAPKRLIGILQK